VARCGGGNTKHNIYIGSRKGTATITRLNTYAANESHAFKTTFGNLIIKDSYFSTVADWSNPNSGPWSTTLIDAAACADIVIEGSHLKATANSSRGSFRPINLRARRDIKSCDLPSYDEPQFTDPAFWASVTALSITDPANPYTFKHFISGTVMEWVATDPLTVPGISDLGTYPRSTSAPIPGPMTHPWRLPRVAPSFPAPRIGSSARSTSPAISSGSGLPTAI
jgi:hypothetical protein